MPAKYSVGIDIAKEKFQVNFTVLEETRKTTIKGSRQFDNITSGFGDFVRWVEKREKDSEAETVFVMEATGTYHEQLAWFLHNQNRKVCLMLANRAKALMTGMGQKSKNDPADAAGLAKIGALHELKEWRPVSKSCYKLRGLTRHHESLHSTKTALNNQKHALRYGMIPLPDVLKGLDSVLVAVEKQLKECESSICKLILEDEELARKTKLVTSIKGVGIMTAAILIAETDGFALFRSVRQLVSYAGYNVRENQSGKRSGKTRITKKGNAHIRRILFLPAFNAVTWDVGNFGQLYRRVYGKTGIKMKAYVAVQSKLLKVIFSLWKNDKVYDSEFHKTSGYQEPKPLFSGGAEGDRQDGQDRNGQHEDGKKEIAVPAGSATLDGLPCDQSPEALFSGATNIEKI
ncbi:IS110 family transposase [Fulvitalea axinellae]|uniref:IS110 family transposase n=1 Tax=Fulvitalea axinellae TaxID=1182444 RepID=A0AAU9CDQ8_9BACT|nr:IS110 family transposase [Fulvitalea axinellae]